MYEYYHKKYYILANTKAIDWISNPYRSRRIVLTHRHTQYCSLLTPNCTCVCTACVCACVSYLFNSRISIAAFTSPPVVSKAADRQTDREIDKSNLHGKICHTMSCWLMVYHRALGNNKTRNGMREKTAQLNHWWKTSIL